MISIKTHVLTSHRNHGSNERSQHIFAWRNKKKKISQTSLTRIFSIALICIDKTSSLTQAIWNLYVAIRKLLWLIRYINNLDEVTSNNNFVKSTTSYRCYYSAGERTLLSDLLNHSKLD